MVNRNVDLWKNRERERRLGGEQRGNYHPGWAGLSLGGYMGLPGAFLQWPPMLLCCLIGLSVSGLQELYKLPQAVKPYLL